MHKQSRHGESARLALAGILLLCAAPLQAQIDLPADGVLRTYPVAGNAVLTFRVPSVGASRYLLVLVRSYGGHSAYVKAGSTPPEDCAQCDACCGVGAFNQECLLRIPQTSDSDYYVLVRHTWSFDASISVCAQTADAEGEIVRSLAPCQFQQEGMRGSGVRIYRLPSIPAGKSLSVLVRSYGGHRAYLRCGTIPSEDAQQDDDFCEVGAFNNECLLEALTASESDWYVLVRHTWSFDANIALRFGYEPSPKPDTTFTQGPCGGVCVLTRNVTFGWQGSSTLVPAENLQYSWRLDGGSWSAPTTATTHDLTGLADGNHTFCVKAVDSCGHEDPTAACCSFSVDLTPPQAAIVSGPCGYPTCSDETLICWTGTDNVTPTSSLMYQWLLDAGPWSALTSATCVDLTGVSIGPHVLQLKAVDACTNETDVSQLAQCRFERLAGPTFGDVPCDNIYWKYVEVMAKKGITGGCSTSPMRYCPYGPVTRAQMAVFLCRAAGKSWLDKPTPTFVDVPRSHWAYGYGYIERLADSGSWACGAPTGGCRVEGSQKWYCPDDPVTRQQMAKFLCIATCRMPAAAFQGKFSDVPQTNPFWSFVEHLTNPSVWTCEPVTSGCAADDPGTPENEAQYCPDQNINRAQMAVFIVRAFCLRL